MRRDQSRAGRQRRAWCRRTEVWMLAGAAVLTREGLAEQKRFDGGTSGTGASWLNAANWNPDGVPTSTDAILLNHDLTTLPATMLLSAGNITVQTVTYNALSAVTLVTSTSTTTNSNLQLNGDGTGLLLAHTAAGGTFTIQGPNAGLGTGRLNLVLNASGEARVTQAEGTLAISAVISEVGGARALAKTGTGRLALSGANTFTGGLTVSAGTLRATTSAAALGAGTMTLQGGTLELANDSGLNFGRATTLAGDATLVVDRLTPGSGTTMTLGALTAGASRLAVRPGSRATTGAPTLSVASLALSGPGATTLDVSSLGTNARPQVIVPGAVSGAGSLAKDGDGIVEIRSPSVAHADTAVRGGTLRWVSTSGTAFGTGTLLLDGGAFATQANAVGAVAHNQAVTVGAAGGSLEHRSMGGSNARTWTAPVSGSGPLTVRAVDAFGPAVLAFTADNPFAGRLTVAGTGSTSYVALRGPAGAFSAVSDVVLEPGLLVLDNAVDAHPDRLPAVPVTVRGGGLRLVGQSGVEVGETVGPVTVAGAGALDVASAGGAATVLTLAHLGRTARGTVLFTASGGTLGQPGNQPRIRIADQPAGLVGPWAVVGSGDFAVHDADGVAAYGAYVPLASAGPADVAASTASETLAASRTVAHLKVFPTAGYMLNTAGAGDVLTLAAGGLVIGGGQAVQVGGSAGRGVLTAGTTELIIHQLASVAAVVNMRLGGSGGLTKGGSGTLGLADNAPTLTGGIVVNSGTLQPAAAGVTNPFGDNPLTVAAGATLVVAQSTAGSHTREVSGAGTVTHAVSGDAPWTLWALADAELAGDWGNAARAALVKRGPAAQAFSGATPGFFSGTNGFRVDRGALVLAGNATCENTTFAAADVRAGGTLVFDNRAVNRADRYPDAQPVNLNGGRLRIEGNAAAASSETLGTLTLGSGRQAGAVEVRNGAGQSAVLAFSTWSRAVGGASVNFAADPARGTLGGTGANPRVLFSTAPAQTNGLIVGGYVQGADFAAYDSVAGIRAFAAYTAGLAGGATSTAVVDEAGATVSTATTVNALKLASASGVARVSLQAGGALTLGTGQLLKSGAGDAVIERLAGAGTLGSSGAELLAYVGQGTLALDLPLALGGNKRLDKHGPGLLTLGAVTVTAATDLVSVAEGALRADPRVQFSGGAAAPVINLVGGVLELTGGGTYNPGLGTSAGNVRWLSTGGGGFAAAGGDVVVDLGAAGPTSLAWGQTNFVPDGSPLLLNSCFADAAVVLADHLALGSAVGEMQFREVYVADNPAAAGDRARLAGTLSGDDQHHLLKTGPGTLELRPASASSYAGRTHVLDGTLLVTADGALGTAGSGATRISETRVVAGATLAFADDVDYTRAEQVSLAGGGALRNAGGDNRFAGPILLAEAATLAAAAGRLTLTGGIELAGQDLTVTGEGTVAVTTAGIAGAGGRVLKTGTGTLELAASCSFAGLMSVSAGGVQLGLEGVLAAGAALEVSGGTVGGEGLIGRALDLQSGTLAPGPAGGTGVLTLDGDLAVAAGATAFDVQLNGPLAGVDYDRLQVLGDHAVTLGGGQLQVSFGGSGWATDHTRLWILDHAGSGPLVGAFANFPNGSEVGQYDGYRWYIYYGADALSGALGGGNDIVILPAPEPGTLGLLVLGLAGVLSMGRRARRG